MTQTLVRRTSRQPVFPQAADIATRGSGPMLLLKRVKQRIRNITLHPYLWMSLGGLLSFVGYIVVDASCGHCLQQSRSPAEETISDPGGLFAEITGPFDQDPAHTEYVRCLRNRATFNVHSIPGSCAPLLQLQHEFATSIDWDHSLCKQFLPDPLESIFLDPARLRFRNGTIDGIVVKDVFCGDNSRYMALLARHLPSDRPLTALDAGAHIGMNTLMLTRYAKFHGKIIALASNRDDMQLLRVNTDNVTHIVTRKHGILVPETVARETDFLSESSTLRSYLGRADYKRFQSLRQRTRGFIWYEGGVPPGAGEIPEGDMIPALSLRQLREFVPTRRFDIVMLDMYSTGVRILRDLGSRQVLCQAICLVVATRTPSAEGAGLARVLQEFEQHGCPSSHRLVFVGSAGKSDVLCQQQSALAVRERAANSHGRGKTRDEG